MMEDQRQAGAVRIGVTSQETLELWMALARVLVDQANVTSDREEKQLATEMAAMAADFADRRSRIELMDLAGAA